MNYIVIGIVDGKIFAMKFIAVVELDNWVDQFNPRECAESAISELKHVVRLYKQCHTIDSWVFSLTYDTCYSSHLDALNELGVQLQPKDCTDPLSAFFELVTHSLPPTQDSSLKLGIIRLVANKKECGSTMIDPMISNHVQQGHHYSRNQPSLFNDSLDIQIMNFDVLKEAWQEALLPDDRIKITPYIYRQQQRLNLGIFPCAPSTILHV